MSFELVGYIANFLGLFIPLVFSFSIARAYARPYFRSWTASYLFYTLAVCLLAMPHLFGSPTALYLATIAVYSAADWFLLKTADTLRPGQPIARYYGPFVAAAAAIGAVLVVTQVPFAICATVTVLAGVAAHWKLAWDLAHLPDVGARRSPKLLASLVAAAGSWTLAFPFLQGDMLVLGYVVSGVLHLLVGMQMVIFLLEDTARMLQAQNEELQHLDKLKSGFMSAVSHELRTPLTSIIGYTELLEDEVGGPLSPEQHDFVSRMQGASEALLGIVDNVLDYVRLEAGTFQLTVQEADLEGVLHRAVQLVGPQFAVNHTNLVMECPDEPVVASVDTRRLTQVITNLLGNAAKFTPAGGTVTLQLRRAGDEIEIRVCDTGIGIQPEHLPRLFDKFFQGDGTLTRRYGGVGLGLAVAKAFVEAHAGRIAVESQPGHGAAFTVCLPATGSAPEGHELAESRA
ncbi:Alkaline phosphatase synthesis sensor protein PhoR [compost metagenome]